MPHSVFRAARILVNPHCPTTYAGVSHTQVAFAFSGSGQDDALQGGVGKYVLEDREGALESFLCTWLVRNERRTIFAGACPTRLRSDDGFDSGEVGVAPAAGGYSNKLRLWGKEERWKWRSGWGGRTKNDEDEHAPA
ncbi:hypothetical protein B0H11DRAFT_1912607 [Mycena galericulata]|nr:hypothetical protein B0H11DRAFT_1912607 [Mycena galericulata]